MKKFQLLFSDMPQTYYVGKAADVKALYKSMLRAYRKGATIELAPNYGPCRFDPLEVYALCIDECGYFDITRGDVFSRLVVDAEKVVIC